MTTNAGTRTIPPAAFFALAFGMSWAIWIPLMLIRLGVLAPVVPVTALTQVALLGVLMPSLAATLVTARVAGRPGVRALYARLGLWRVGRWWIAILLIQPVLLVVTAVVYNEVGRGDLVRMTPALGVGTVFTTVAFLVIASTGEEIGWRGVGLHVLQDRYGPIRASVVLALATATWHIPYWVLQGVTIQHGIGYLALDYLFIAAITFQLTWLFNHTGGSVLVAVAFHVTFNTVNVAFLSVTASTGAFALLTVTECVISLALISRLTPPAGKSNGSGRREVDRGSAAGR